MPFISAENLIQGYPNIQPETVNLIRWFYSQFNSRSAANRNIVNVEPLYYKGAIAGTEFLTYTATKLYLCINSQWSGDFSTRTAGGCIRYYNEANVIFYIGFNYNLLWNASTPALNVYHSNFELKNQYFSRIDQSASAFYLYMIFNGYRITLV